jgi:hypothetical protein
VGEAENGVSANNAYDTPKKKAQVNSARLVTTNQDWQSLCNAILVIKQETAVPPPHLFGAEQSLKSQLPRFLAAAIRIFNESQSL